MRTDTVTYFNGRRYMRRVRHPQFLPCHATTYITFAYSGVPGGWPVIINYTLR